MVGNLGWNANSTLASLNITDPFNSADTQNCSFSHDDLTRIASVNCGTSWAQTFAYDAFGNINKSGSMSFQPTYPPTTNRITGAPYAYDANGSMTNDEVAIHHL